MSRLIVFDLLCAQPMKGRNGWIKFHGGGEYTKTIFYELSNCIGEGMKLYACYDSSNYIDEWVQTIINHNTQIIAKQCTDYNEIVKFLNTLDSSNDDIVFYTGMIYPYRIDNCKLPESIMTVGTCHGLRDLEKPYDIESWRYATEF